MIAGTVHQLTHVESIQMFRSIGLLAANEVSHRLAPSAATRLKPHLNIKSWIGRIEEIEANTAKRKPIDAAIGAATKAVAIYHDLLKIQAKRDEARQLRNTLAASFQVLNRIKL